MTIGKTDLQATILVDGKILGTIPYEQDDESGLSLKQANQLKEAAEAKIPADQRDRAKIIIGGQDAYGKVQTRSFGNVYAPYTLAELDGIIKQESKGELSGAKTVSPLTGASRVFSPLATLINTFPSAVQQENAGTDTAQISNPATSAMSDQQHLAELYGENAGLLFPESAPVTSDPATTHLHTLSSLYVDGTTNQQTRILELNEGPWPKTINYKFMGVPAGKEGSYLMTITNLDAQNPQPIPVKPTNALGELTLNEPGRYQIGLWGPEGGKEVALGILERRPREKPEEARPQEEIRPLTEPRTLHGGDNIIKNSTETDGPATQDPTTEFVVNSDAVPQVLELNFTNINVVGRQEPFKTYAVITHPDGSEEKVYADRKGEFSARHILGKSGTYKVRYHMAQIRKDHIPGKNFLDDGQLQLRPVPESELSPEEKQFLEDNYPKTQPLARRDGKPFETGQATTIQLGDVNSLRVNSGSREEEPEKIMASATAEKLPES